MAENVMISKVELEKLRKIQEKQAQKIADKNISNKEKYKVINVNLTINQYNLLKDLASYENLTPNMYLKELFLKSIK